MIYPKLLPEIDYLLAGISGVLLLIILDVITGVASAIHNKKFDLKKLANFLYRDILPYVIVWGAFGSIPITLLHWKFPDAVVNAFAGYVGIAYIFILATLSKSIYENIKEIGMPTKDGGVRNE